jgi:hypothetical protein
MAPRRPLRNGPLSPHPKLLTFLALSGCLSLAGCLLDPGDCTTEARFGLRVLVRDAQTGASAGLGALARATADAYAENLQAFADSLTFVGATERPGVYDIVVTRTGYQSWTIHGVVVRPGKCHVDAQTIDARIQPIGPSSPPEQRP